MNILLMTSSFLPAVGGREYVVHHLASALASIGHKVTVFVPFDKKRKNNRENPYHIVQFGFRGAGRLNLMKPCMYLTLYYLLAKFRFDVINVHGVFWRFTGLFPFLKRFSPVPLVATPHGHDIQVFADIGYGARLNPRNDQIVKMNIRLSDRVTAISRSIRTHIEEIVEDRSRIVDLPNGIWTDSFRTIQNRENVREKYELPVDSVLLVSVGRNHPKKGFDIGVEALAKLRRKGRKIAYAFIGRDMEPLREKAAELGVSDSIFTPGQLDPENVAELFQASDIYISPSWIESFGITTIEAMSAGLPCIVSDIEGSRDIVSADFGVVTRPGDAEALAAAIQRLADDKELTRQMGRAARIEAKKYDWLKIAGDYVRVYQELMIS